MDLSASTAVAREGLEQETSETAEMKVLKDFQDLGLLPDVNGLVVWDLGCGAAAYSDALSRMGAARVHATDIHVHWDQVSASVRENPCIELAEVDLEGAGELFARTAPPDLAFLNLMTEHVAHPRTFFAELARLLKPGSSLFLHHDNYYHPVGHHDHPFLFLNESTWAIEPQGVRCWEMPEKCAASAEHRKRICAGWPAIWSPASEGTMDPNQCNTCNYFRRSVPWAHLLNIDHWTEIWPEPMFRHEFNTLSILQLRRYLEEVGFVIQEERRVYLANEPPESLCIQFGRENLVVFTWTALTKLT